MSTGHALLVVLAAGVVFLAKLVMQNEYWPLANAIGSVVVRLAGLILPRQGRADRVAEWLGELGEKCRAQESGLTYALGTIPAALRVHRVRPQRPLPSLGAGFFITVAVAGTLVYSTSLIAGIVLWLTGHHRSAIEATVPVVIVFVCVLAMRVNAPGISTRVKVRNQGRPMGLEFWDEDWEDSVLEDTDEELDQAKAYLKALARARDEKKQADRNRNPYA
ncbi:MAG TPA: hypothetical protein VHW92_10050 [Mycobacteriales bacterium]|jgi:hypothetical protein|nr:hypothetical protein [Mycobacteriales bacterium]